MRLTKTINNLKHTIDYFKTPCTEFQAGRLFEAEKLLKELIEIENKSLNNLDIIISDIENCYETTGRGCSNWCGSDDCVGGCVNYKEYQELNRTKLENLIKKW
jgi:hypothetical protein